MEDRDVFLLENIVDFCDRIINSRLKYGSERSDFDNNLDYQEMCAFRLIQIGENANNLSDRLKEAHPEIPWHKIVASRNILTHDYGRVDNNVIWETITDDILPLREFCAKQIGLE